MADYVTVPSNLICLKCKYCCHHLHAQAPKDIENHFKSEHPTVKNPKKHLDYLCRICMQCDVNETLEDLEQHLEEEHSELKPKCNNDDDSTTKRKDEKATSPDVSSELVRPLLEQLIESFPIFN